MSKKIKVVGFDPAISNWGVCKAMVDIDTLEFTVESLDLIKTSSESKKGVRKQSDDLRRAREMYQMVTESYKDAALVISEIPLGSASMYSNAIVGAGTVIGILASIKKPIIQVFPQDVKLLACGSRNASKEEVLEWAVEKFPDAPWLTRKTKGKVALTAANEHLADAVAIINAGLRTEEFAQAISMFKSMSHS